MLVDPDKSYTLQKYGDCFFWHVQYILFVLQGGCIYCSGHAQHLTNLDTNTHADEAQSKYTATIATCLSEWYKLCHTGN